MPETARRTAAKLVAAALLVLTGPAAVATATATAGTLAGGRQAAISMGTPGVPCASCGG